MATTNETVVVNGGCFPLQWVRKIFNIKTDQIEDSAISTDKIADNAVTNAKLSADVQGILDMVISNMTADKSASLVNLKATTVGGSTMSLSLQSATNTMAGVMSANDKTKLDAIDASNVYVVIGTKDGATEEASADAETGVEYVIREITGTIPSQSSYSSLADYIYALSKVHFTCIMAIGNEVAISPMNVSLASPLQAGCIAQVSEAKLVNVFAPDLTAGASVTVKTLSL